MPKRITVKFKVWLECDGRPLLGEGGATLLRLIGETGSIAGAARKMGVSYGFAWGYVRRLEHRLGVKIVEARRGGHHGGYTRLTEHGLRLLKEYERAVALVRQALGNRSFRV